MSEGKNMRQYMPEIPEKEQYSPALTDRVKRQAVSEIVANGRDLLMRNPSRVDLADVEAVKAATNEYLQRCVRLGTLPTLQGVSAVLGVTRRALYKHLETHPDDETGQFLERLRSSFTTWRVEAADKGAAKEVLTIFLLKNSSQGYTDRVDVAQVEASPVYPVQADDELKKRYLTDVGIEEADDE